MLNKWFVNALLVIGLIAPGASMAEDLKIGFVDGARLVQEAPQAKEASARMTKEFQPRQDELIKLQDKVTTDEEKFVKDSAFMSAAEKQKREREIVAAKRDLRFKETEFREDLTIRRSEEMEKVWAVLRKAIQSYGEEKGFDLIMFEGVSYASDRVNVTDDILKQLGK